MKIKKTIGWAMIISAVLLAAAGGLRLVEISYWENRNKQRNEAWQRHCNATTGEFQKFLNETAARIRRLPAEPAVVSGLATEIVRRSPLIHLQVWFSDVQGGFAFGEPYTTFRRLNVYFDRFGQRLVSSGTIIDRNDFLLRMANHLNELEQEQEDVPLPRPVSSAGDSPSPAEGDSVVDFIDRFRVGHDSDVTDFSEPLQLTLSSQVLDEQGQPLGTLFAKVDDRTFAARLESERYSLRNLLFGSSGPLAGFAVLILWLLLPSWVYIDARQRNMRNALRWALLTALSVGFAWLIYMLVRPEAAASFSCPLCRKELNGTRAFCPHCGHDLSSSFCSGCQYPVQAEWKFCPSCRCDLTRKTEEHKPESGATE